MNEITIGDKTYISAKRAAEITGYARDYVGQLCREGHVDAKMVGRSWYVYEPAIRAHRFGADAVTEPQNGAQATNSETPAASAPHEGPADEVSAWTRPTYTPESPEMLPELTAPRIEELLPPAEETLTDMQAAWREWFDQRQNDLQTPEIESPEVIDARNESEEPQEDGTEGADEEETAIPLHRLEEEAPEVPETLIEEEKTVPIRAIPSSPAAVSAPVRAAHLDIAPPQPAAAPFRAAPAIHSVSASVPTRYSAEVAAPIEHGKIVSERIVRSPQPPRPQKKQKAQRSGSNAPIIAILVGISLISIAVAAIGTGYANRYLKTLPSRGNPAINFLLGTSDFTRQ